MPVTENLSVAVMAAPLTVTVSVAASVTEKPESKRAFGISDAVDVNGRSVEIKREGERSGSR